MKKQDKVESIFYTLTDLKASGAGVIGVFHPFYHRVVK